MPLEVLAAVLAAALCHAGWNAAAKSSGGIDPLVATSAIAIGGGLVALPLLAVSGLPAPASHGAVLGSGVVHVVYFVLVGLAYRGAHYTAVYPITRGSAPLFTTVLAAGVLGEMPGLPGWCGIVLICSGVLLLGAGSARSGGLSARSLKFAAANVVVIVGYTLLDGWGVRASQNPGGYVLAMMALTGFFLMLTLLVWQGRQIVSALLPLWRVGLGGGAMVLLSYGTALWAMTMAPIGVVAALRETSVLFAALIGSAILKEPFGAGRWLATGVMLAGLIALRIG